MAPEIGGVRLALKIAASDSVGKGFILEARRRVGAARLPRNDLLELGLFLGRRAMAFVDRCDCCNPAYECLFMTAARCLANWSRYVSRVGCIISQKRIIGEKTFDRSEVVLSVLNR
jgi:hypothetical protein